MQFVFEWSQGRRNRRIALCYDGTQRVQRCGPKSIDRFQIGSVLDEQVHNLHAVRYIRFLFAGLGYHVQRSGARQIVASIRVRSESDKGLHSFDYV